MQIKNFIEFQNLFFHFEIILQRPRIFFIDQNILTPIPRQFNKCQNLLFDCFAGR